MSAGAIIVAVISACILWGGFACCLAIALKSDK